MPMPLLPACVTAVIRLRLRSAGYIMRVLYNLIVIQIRESYNLSGISFFQFPHSHRRMADNPAL